MKKNQKTKPAWLAEIGAELAKAAEKVSVRRRCQPPEGLAPPPFPDLPKRLRDLAAMGFGPKARPFIDGLRSQGMGKDAATAAFWAAAKQKLVVPYEGGWRLA